jgi:hypothetical protein
MICLGISSPGFMSEVEIETAEVQGPPCLSAREVLCHMPVFQVSMIGDNVERLRETLQIVSPVFEGTDDGEHLFVVDLVISFCFNHGLGPEGDRMLEVVFQFFFFFFFLVFH